MIRIIFASCLVCASFESTPGDDSFPIVPEGMEVSLFARDPLVRNPCAITFDARGRLCVGMGPQYRRPDPDTTGDSVFLIIDDDGDGKAESRKRFATGFNSIQGLAWWGDVLWVANAPDLTLVRDVDGDDEADEYIRLWTDLGNLEHALHGLNVGPDGRMYMSKGNSKGLTQPPQRLAPRPFRKLWGVDYPNLPEAPDSLLLTRQTYRKNYHHPSDDWGRQGGVLRCSRDGKGLEIVSRGFRNPWDITFDDAFNWLGTDNDQTLGDKVFSPFFGAQFGWGHAWSYDWSGKDHLPTVPASAALFEGSGTGVIFCASDVFPKPYRGSFLICDWLRREVYLLRSEWRGALLHSRSEALSIFAHAGGGRSMANSSGRSFDPVDIEIGPEGAVYISSWGREYGVKYEAGEAANEGRIYRIQPRGAKPSEFRQPRRQRAISSWTGDELVEDLGSHVPAWRVNAQDELIRRGDVNLVKKPLEEKDTSTLLRTWSAWTLGRMSPRDLVLDRYFIARARPGGLLASRVQAVRILAFRGAATKLREFLEDAEPRVRHEVLLALQQNIGAILADKQKWLSGLTDLVATETDRIVYYSAWGVLKIFLSTEERKDMLQDARPALRRAALLGLLEDDLLSRGDVSRMAEDSDRATASLASRWLGGRAKVEIRGAPLRSQPSIVSAVPVLSFVRDIASLGGRDASYLLGTIQVGVKAYSDRDYKFSKVPPELDGEALIQTANDDAESGRIRLRFQVEYPSEIFVALDERIPRAPSWLESYVKTKLRVSTDDAEFCVYSKKFPAGEVLLGPNSDGGVKGGRSNYIAVIRPEMLVAPRKATRLSEVLSLLDGGDSQRGRDLFLSKQGAGCIRCHRLEGIGKSFSPDLTGIGDRADAAFIARSILDPSASITEGFATQVFTMRGGAVESGIVLQETARSIRLVKPSAEVLDLPVSRIEIRQGTASSAMPSFSDTLKARDVADISAYLLSSRNAPAVGKEGGN